MTAVHVVGISVLGPGLPGWPEAGPVLAGRQPWEDGAVALPPPALLSATERRRAGTVVRLALTVAGAAVAHSALPTVSLRPVFASGYGDGPTVGAILDTLSQPDGLVSPTQFHNSVHNAAAGYWSIGAGSQQPATCVGGHAWSFGCGLMTAVAACMAEHAPVLLCVYDAPMPPPLDRAAGPTCLFGMALVLAPEGPGPRLSIGWRMEPATRDSPTNPALRALAAGNPAARSLRLLEALAKGGSDAFDVALLDGSLAVTLRE